MSVQELQAAIAKLPNEELAHFAQWFEQFIADERDAPTASGARYPLRGTPVTLLLPTEPVADEEWDSEICDRIRSIDEGRVAGVSYEDVIRSAKDRLVP